MQLMIEKDIKINTQILKVTLINKCQEWMNSMITPKSLHRTQNKIILVLPVTIETFNQKHMIISQLIKIKTRIQKTCFLNLECLNNLLISRNLHNLEHSSNNSSKNLNIKKIHIIMIKRSVASKKLIDKIKLIL